MNPRDFFDAVRVVTTTSLEQVQHDLKVARKKVEELEAQEKELLNSTENLLEQLILQRGWRVLKSSGGWYCTPHHMGAEYLRDDLNVYPHSPAYYDNKVDALKLLARFLLK